MLILTDFDDIWHADAAPPVGPRLPVKFCDVKNQDVTGGHLKNSKNRNISVMK